MAMGAVREGQEFPQASVEGVTVSEASPRSEVQAAVEERQERAVEAYARGHEGLSGDDERDALDYLLGAKTPREYDVKVMIDTDMGQAELVFAIRAQDGLKIDRIEQSHVNESTGRVNLIDADAEILGEACFELRSASKVVDPKSPEFRTMRIRRVDTGEESELVHPSAGEALKARFRDQLGLLGGVARQVRLVSGFDPGRVADAKRRLVSASGN